MSERPPHAPSPELAELAAEVADWIRHNAVVPRSRVTEAAKRAESLAAMWPSPSGAAELCRAIAKATRGMADDAVDRGALPYVSSAIETLAQAARRGRSDGAELSAATFELSTVLPVPGANATGESPARPDVPLATLTRRRDS